ncbi:MAG: helix-turn-helix domain-containing protein [Bacteroidetes bacterium]|nr:helix-turn-helix domain-containing protein [Bacteroidota bacterium]
MDGLVLVKISELSDVLREVKTIRQKIEHLQSEKDMRTYTVQQAAEMLNFSYNTVRKLIRERKLVPKYADDKRKKGKCSIPAWSIKQYLIEAKGV